MDAFLHAIPEAAKSTYAFGAYSIAAILFLFAGYKLRWTRTVAREIRLLPKADQFAAFQLMTGVVLPESITPDDWLRHARTRWMFMLLGGVLIAGFAVAVIALNTPAGISETQGREIQDGVHSIARDQRRAQYPLDDATIFVRLRLNTGTSRPLRDYVEWVQERIRNHFSEHPCYNLIRNQLKIEYVRAPGSPEVDEICFPPEHLLIPAVSPLFPTAGENGAAAEALGRLMVILEFFDADRGPEDYEPTADRGILVMKAEARGSTDPKKPFQGLAVEINGDALYILAKLPSTRDRWRRAPELTSLLDLMGKRIYLWVQIGKKEFFSEELDPVRQGAILSDVNLTIGRLIVSPMTWETKRGPFGEPVFVVPMPDSEDGLLTMLK